MLLDVLDTAAGDAAQPLVLVGVEQAFDQVPGLDRQTARKGTVLARKTVEPQQKGSALLLTSFETG
eukprot:SAG22_NODE_823_length_6993_cov_6.116913_4_plen_66_part_00